ncbi:MAG: acyl-CoA thioesterase [Gaiellales bacterium]
MDGYRFSTEVVARFNETDAQGIVHHGVHLLWFEVARIAYLSRLEGGYRGLVEGGVDVTTIDAHVKYGAPVRFDDRLAIWTRCVDVRGARLRFEYVIERVSDPVGIVAEGWTGHACVDAATMRPTRVPADLADRFERLET